MATLITASNFIYVPICVCVGKNEAVSATLFAPMRLSA